MLSKELTYDKVIMMAIGEFESIRRRRAAYPRYLGLFTLMDSDLPGRLGKKGN